MPDRGNPFNLHQDPPTAPMSLGWNTFKPWDRHGLILMVAGIINVLIGAAFVSSPTARLGDISINIFPGNTVYYGFIIAGAIAVMSARWPSKPRTLGYTALTGWTSSTGCVYIWGGFEEQNASFLATGLIWILMAFLWWAISGLISPPSERARSGVPSPHRDHSGGFDRYASGYSDTTLFSQSEPSNSPRVEPVRNGERGLRAS